MNRRSKLIERLLRQPPEVQFSDIQTLLEDFGWTLARTRGSHMAFTKPGEGVQVVPTHGGMVKRTYVRQICERLNLDIEEETN